VYVLGRDPPHVRGIRSCGDRVRVRVGQIVDENIMITDATRLIAGDPIHDTCNTGQAYLNSALLYHLPPRCRRGGLTETSGKAPLAQGGRASALHEQDSPLVQDNRADTDARIRGVFAGHATPVSQTSVV
jgi:hypothetical protein